MIAQMNYYCIKIETFATAGTMNNNNSKFKYNIFR